MPDAPAPPRTAAELAELLRPLLPGVALVKWNECGVTLLLPETALTALVDLAACRRERDQYRDAWRGAMAREAGDAAVSEADAARMLR
jgi:hypothetical protein